RGIIADAAVQVGQLHSHLAPFRLHGEMSPPKDGALFLAHSYAESRGLSEDQARNPRTVFRAAKHGQQHAWTVLLHLRRGAENIKRTGSERLLHHIAEDLRRHVVYVGFKDRNFFHWDMNAALREKGILAQAFTHTQPQHVGDAVEVARARSISGRGGL